MTAGKYNLTDFLPPHRIHLPNFFGGLLPVVATVIASLFVHDLWFCRFSFFMIFLLALAGLCDVIANHYREKLTQSACHGPAMGS